MIKPNEQAIPFEERSFRPRQAGLILDLGKTKIHELINAGELESYLDGTARKITGSSIVAYRQRKLQERGRRPLPQLANRKAKRKTAPNSGAVADLTIPEFLRR